MPEQFVFLWIAWVVSRRLRRFLRELHRLFPADGADFPQMTLIFTQMAQTYIEDFSLKVSG